MILNNLYTLSTLEIINMCIEYTSYTITYIISKLDSEDKMGEYTIFQLYNETQLCFMCGSHQRVVKNSSRFVFFR